MAGQRNSYGKRSRPDPSDNSNFKKRNPGDEKDTYLPGPEDTVYRYLCPLKTIGSIIGRGGEIVKQLRSETESKIRIGDAIRGCDERVVTIFSSSRETNSLEDNSLEDTGNYVCPAQDALLKVYERLVKDENEDPESDDQVSARLLVPSDQIGCIIGKGGQIIQGIRTDSGAQVRILKNEASPCAVSGDELLQITGDTSAVKKALMLVAQRLHDNPSQSIHLLSSSAPTMYPPGGQYGGANAVAPIVGMGQVVGPYGSYKGQPGSDWFLHTPRDKSSAKDFSLRLICPSVNIGGVIGKGGVIIKQIRQESGAFIKVDSSNADDDCIITISTKEFFDDPISPTIDAAVRLQPRCSEKTERESGDASYTTRLLVSTSRIGCLIGKGGSIISEMRRATRASIRILPKENLPKVANEDDEMVQISGDLDVVKNALVQVTTRLKANFFEREGALPSLVAPAPYAPVTADYSDGSKYGSRDSKAYLRGYSSYGGGYGGTTDVLPPDTYGSYGSSQGGGSGYGYGGYGGYSSARPGSAGYPSQNPLSHGKGY